MVKNHSDSERGNMGYSFRLAASVFFYMHNPTDRITHTTAFVTPVVSVNLHVYAYIYIFVSPINLINF